jgi:diaminopimelate decarboxylase
VLVRVNPGVSAPTHEAMATGHDGSKFGVPAAQLDAVFERVRSIPALRLDGMHVHIGSQIVELAPFSEAVAGVARLGSFGTYDLGGGLGVRYHPDEPEAPTVDAYAEALIGAVHEHLGTDCRLIVEPGRSLVARSAVTAYRVVTVKRGGPRTFVNVDGGMGDNLEPMLYGTRFAPFVLDAGNREPETCDVVGPHCETGDRLVADVELAAPQRDDIIVVPVTGAYCLSLANNYNGMPRPPVLLCRDGQARTVTRRETIEDLLARHR